MVLGNIGRTALPHRTHNYGGDDIDKPASDDDDFGVDELIDQHDDDVIDSALNDLDKFIDDDAPGYIYDYADDDDGATGAGRIP